MSSATNRADYRDVSYVHGYDERESERLHDQAGALVALLHHDTRYAPGARVLEAGCGVGAQTVPPAANRPGAPLTAVDVSPALPPPARRRGASNVRVWY